MKRGPHSGLSLAEAIIAIFVLLSGVVVLTRLFHTGLRYQTLVENQATAVMLGERQLERVRGWSREVHKTQDFVDWSGCPWLGGPTPDPDYPGFTLTTLAVAHRLYSPCELFESLYPASRQRRISSSVRKVTVSVGWGNNLKLDLVSLVAMPTGEPGSVTLNIVGPTTMPKDDRRPFTVSAENSNGTPIRDLFFEYIVQPENGDTGGGFGAFESPRDGRSCVLRNCVYGADRATITGYGVGQCKLQAIARYRGKLMQGSSDALDMRP